MAGNKAKLIVAKALSPKQFKNIDTIRIDDSRIKRESELVKKVRDRFGTGKYNLMIVKKGQRGYRQVWFGEIEQDSFRRERGKLTQYIDGIEPEHKNPRDQWTKINA